MRPVRYLRSAASLHAVGAGRSGIATGAGGSGIDIVATSACAAVPFPLTTAPMAQPTPRIAASVAPARMRLRRLREPPLERGVPAETMVRSESSEGELREGAGTLA